MKSCEFLHRRKNIFVNNVICLKIICLGSLTTCVWSDSPWIDIRGGPKNTIQNKWVERSNIISAKQNFLKPIWCPFDAYFVILGAYLDKIWIVLLVRKGPRCTGRKNKLKGYTLAMSGINISSMQTSFIICNLYVF